MIKLYNTKSHQTEDFKPQKDGVVTLYTCGPTVYDSLHVGNWSAYIYWDTLVRLLGEHGNQVNRVMNITDVGHLVSDGDEGEDKLEKGARRENKTAWDIAKFYTDDFLNGMKALNLIAPTHISKATDYIDQQIDLVRILKANGHTYQISDGIYFDTSTFANYADFAKLNLESQQAGARVDHNPEKRHSSDFALWKFSPENEKRDMEWETPPDILEREAVQMGFPGWHLECSAMAMSILGNTIDIHTGGIDHIPVHHTNEIAQSESASGVQFANYWMHNNHLKVDGSKISKSLGNGFTLQDLAGRGFDPLDFRIFVLQSHYQSESNFSFENLTAAKNRLTNWRKIAVLRHQIANFDSVQSTTNPSRRWLYETLENDLVSSLDDNLNTPAALAAIDAALSEINEYNLFAVNKAVFSEQLKAIDRLLGLEIIAQTPDIDDASKQLILARQRARDSKDWPKSDALRRQLSELGIGLNDTDTRTLWHYAQSAED